MLSVILLESIPIDRQLVNIAILALRTRLNDHLLPQPVGRKAPDSFAAREVPAVCRHVAEIVFRPLSSF